MAGTLDQQPRNCHEEFFREIDIDMLRCTNERQAMPAISARCGGAFAARASGFLPASKWLCSAGN
jgi:hypothetical protein